MLKKCRHSFCSFCIRNWMSGQRQHCPQCRHPAVESDLQRNPELDRLVNKVLQDHPELEDKVSQDSSQTLATIPEGTCPVCLLHIGPRRLEAHVDMCLTRPRSVAPYPSLKKETIPQKKLPKRVYHLMKEKAIRKLLADHKLPTTGPKQALIKRHKEFVNRFNANLDAATPKPVELLRTEMKEWEAIHASPRVVKTTSKRKQSDCFDLLIAEYYEKFGKPKRKKRFNGCGSTCLWKEERLFSIKERIYLNESDQTVSFERPKKNDHKKCTGMKTCIA